MRSTLAQLGCFPPIFRVNLARLLVTLPMDSEVRQEAMDENRCHHARDRPPALCRLASGAYPLPPTLFTDPADSLGLNTLQSS